MNKAAAWRDDEALDAIRNSVQQAVDAAVTAAVKDYISEGFFSLETDTLNIAFVAADPLDEIEKRISLDKLIREELIIYMDMESPSDLNGVLSYDFKDNPWCVRLQAALRCLVAP